MLNKKSHSFLNYSSIMVPIATQIWLGSSTQISTAERDLKNKFIKMAQMKLISSVIITWRISL